MSIRSKRVARNATPLLLPGREAAIKSAAGREAGTPRQQKGRPLGAALDFAQRVKTAQLPKKPRCHQPAFFFGASPAGSPWAELTIMPSGGSSLRRRRGGSLSA